MEQRAGIWQGRFQFVHKGHYSIYKKVLTKYKEKYIAIVNPNPIIPSFNYERFKIDNNPFSYFKRMMMWKLAINSDNLDVRFFPCWHGRFKIALENDFLPSINCRCWIIPSEMDLSQEAKRKDLERQGEHVYTVPYEDIEEHQVSATTIRTRLRENRDWKQFLPSQIHEYTANIIKDIDIFDYYLIPVIDDKLDLYALDEGIKRINQNLNAFIVFVMTIGVVGEDGEDGVIQSNASKVWWFNKSERLKNTLSFSKKVNIITNYMRENLNRVLFTPYFILNNDANNLYEYCQAFLPNQNKSYWLISEKTYDNYFFCTTLENDDVQIDRNIPIDIIPEGYEYFKRNTGMIVSSNYSFDNNELNNKKILEYLDNKVRDIIDTIMNKIEVCRDQLNRPKLQCKMAKNINEYEHIKQEVLTFKVQKNLEINKYYEINDTIYSELISTIDCQINYFFNLLSKQGG